VELGNKKALQVGGLLVQTNGVVLLQKFYVREKPKQADLPCFGKASVRRMRSVEGVCIGEIVAQENKPVNSQFFKIEGQHMVHLAWQFLLDGHFPKCFCSCMI
jgi:hypothetical protein